MSSPEAPPDRPATVGIADDVEKKIDFGYEAVKERFQREYEDSKEYDSKAGSIVGYVSLMTGLLIGLGTFALLDKLSKPEYYAPFLTAMILFLATITLSLLSIRLVRYRDAPDISLVKKNLNDGTISSRDFKKDLLIAMDIAIEHNSAKNKHKSKLLRASWWCLIVGFIFLIIYAGIYITTNASIDDKGLQLNNNTLAALLVYNLLPEIDNDTLARLFPGIGEDDDGSEFKSLGTVPIIRPDTNDPWIELRNQWRHDDLNVYVMSDPKKSSPVQALTVIKAWSDILKTASHNSSAWNFNTGVIQNLSQINALNLNPADIVVILRDEPIRIKCQDSWGYSEKRNENKHYAIVYTSCNSAEASKEQIVTTLYHELGHTLGLGHAFNKNMDLMCGVDENFHNEKTCSGNTSLSEKPSALDVNALLYSYGIDGFGDPNRELGSKAYYLPSSNASLPAVPGNNTKQNAS